MNNSNGTGLRINTVGILQFHSISKVGITFVKVEANKVSEHVQDVLKSKVVAGGVGRSLKEEYPVSACLTSVKKSLHTLTTILLP